MKECFGPEVSYGETETETGKTDKGRQKGQTQKKKQGQTQGKKQRRTIKKADAHRSYVK